MLKPHIPGAREAGGGAEMSDTAFSLKRTHKGQDPVILILIAISRRAAIFDRAKRAFSYALLSEAFTFCLSITVIVFSTPSTGQL